MKTIMRHQAHFQSYVRSSAPSWELVVPSEATIQLAMNADEQKCLRNTDSAPGSLGIVKHSLQDDRLGLLIRLQWRFRLALACSPSRSIPAFTHQALSSLPVRPGCACPH